MDKIALLNWFRKICVEEGDVDFLREGLKVLAEAVMGAEVSQLIGAGRFERTPGRKNYRNGYRTREWDTRLGTIELNIPKLRKGSYFPSLLEPRRRAEKALKERGPGGVCAWGQYAQSRRIGGVVGSEWHQQKRDLPYL